MADTEGKKESAEGCLKVEDDQKTKEWKRGSGKFGMLRESKAKRDNPKNFNFLRGMCNPRGGRGDAKCTLLGAQDFVSLPGNVSSKPTQKPPRRRATTGTATSMIRP